MDRHSLLYRCEDAGPWSGLGGSSTTLINHFPGPLFWHPGPPCRPPGPPYGPPGPYTLYRVYTIQQKQQKQQQQISRNKRRNLLLAIFMPFLCHYNVLFLLILPYSGSLLLKRHRTSSTLNSNDFK